jgi:hypothetical protein
MKPSLSLITKLFAWDRDESASKQLLEPSKYLHERPKSFGVSQARKA